MDRSARIIAVAPNGARRTKTDHPGLPMTAGEVARAAKACLAAGAGLLHLHVRDRDGRHSLDAGLYREAMSEVRSVCGRDLVVQITTEAGGRYAPAEQMAVVRELHPEAVSLALRELAPKREDEAELGRFMGLLADQSVMAQVILYDRADRDRLRALVDAGVISAEGLGVIYVLGRYAAGQTSEPADLDPFLAPSGSPFVQWMVCAFGKNEARVMASALAKGGGARVGFENNLHLPDGGLAPDNAALVAAAVALLAPLGLRPASADEIRAGWYVH